MSLKNYHKYLGLVMVLPFIAWAITGVFFFVKPGYSEAYDQLTIKQYPTISNARLPDNNEWLEVRRFTSILGEHLLVKSNDKWLQIDNHTFEVKPEPSSNEVELLVSDAIANKSERYGDVSSVNGLSAVTSTDININLNWQQMSLYQKGPDTNFINNMYKIHYLQWTGVKSIDKVLGIVGLVLVVILALLGVRLTFKRQQTRPN